MATYSVQAPDGNTYTVQGPAGATDDQVRAEVLRQHPDAASKPSAIADAWQQFSGHAQQALGRTVDQLANFSPGVGAIDRVMSGVSPLGQPGPMGQQGNFFQRLVTGRPDVVNGQPVWRMGTPPAPAQTTAGRYAGAVGDMVPAAMFPGSLLQRAANVVAPAIGSQVARDTTKALGGGQVAQDVASMAGGMAGGVAASVRMAPKAAPISLDTLQENKNAAYQAVDQSGIAIKPQAMQTLAQNVADDLKSVSMNPMRHPAANSMLEDIQGVAQGQEPTTLTGLDQLRQVVRRDVASSPNHGEAFMGKRIINTIDQFTSGLGPQDVVTNGSVPPEQAASLLQTARDANTRFMKVQAVSDALEAAGYQAGKSGSGGNIDNATRNQMYKVMKSIPNLTDEEQVALDRIILGGKGQDLLRGVGKLSPSGSGLMTALEIGMGHAGAGAAITGLAAKVASDKITQAKVQQLMQLMAAGGTKAKVQAAAVAAQPQLTAQNPYVLPPVVSGVMASSPALAQQPQN